MQSPIRKGDARGPAARYRAWTREMGAKTSLSGDQRRLGGQ
jgi:hypothetical protein